MVNQVNAQEEYVDKDLISAQFPFTQEQCQ